MTLSQSYSTQECASQKPFTARHSFTKNSTSHILVIPCLFMYTPNKLHQSFRLNAASALWIIPIWRVLFETLTSEHTKDQLGHNLTAIWNHRDPIMYEVVEIQGHSPMEASGLQYPKALEKDPHTQTESARQQGLGKHRDAFQQNAFLEIKRLIQ